MIDTVLFDLGNTLVRYLTKPEFPGLLEQAINQVQSHLRQEGLLVVSPEALWQQVTAENFESPDHRVRPLEDRLIRIFQLDPNLGTEKAMSLCRSFLTPFFARAQRYEDSLETLETIKSEGFKTAIVSNLPWGSPSAPWREEVARLGLSERVDAVIFCADVGWRKPARQIFEFTLEKLGSRPQDCIFVGDNPSWDLAGPRAMGMEAILIDRYGIQPDLGEEPVRNLSEFLAKLRSEYGLGRT